jgi:DNA polymerase-1
LLKLLREERPEAVALARDLPGKTFRHEQYADYKAGRPRLAAALVSQLGLLDKLVEAFGFPLFGVPGFEADDVLATLATRLGGRGRKVVVVTGDRDLLQLVDTPPSAIQACAPQAGSCSVSVEVLFVGQRGKAPVRYDRAAVEARFGVLPARLPGYVALVGDSSDNIPKIKGIGAAKASALMRQFATAAELLNQLEVVEPPRLRALLSDHASQIRQSESLVRLRRDVVLPELEPTAFDAAARERTSALFEAWEFKSLLPRLQALP